MTDIEEITIERVTGCTNHITDQHRCLAVLAYAEKRGIRDEALRIILDQRYQRLNWLTVTQRKWQLKTRNTNKARCHDSIEIREKYVRC